MLLSTLELSKGSYIQLEQLLYKYRQLGGDIGFLFEPGYIHTKNVAIIPQTGIDPLYFNIAMQRNIDLFMHKYATGINIQEHEVGKFPIYLHDYETQKAIVLMFRQLEHEMIVERDTVNALKDLKSNMLKNMFV